MDACLEERQGLVEAVQRVRRAVVRNDLIQDQELTLSPAQAREEHERKSTDLGFGEAVGQAAVLDGPRQLHLLEVALGALQTIRQARSERDDSAVK